MSNLSIHVGQYDPSAKQDGQIVATDAQAWSNIDALRRDDVDIGSYLTCEHNYSILDGQMIEFPDIVDDIDFGWWSDSLSDANGDFGAPPTLDITFGKLHKSPGLTLLFYPHTGDYAREVRVTWYDGTLENVIHTGVYTIDSNVGIVRQAVDGWKKIKIEALSTNIRNRYIKMYGIQYGIQTVFEDGMINTASILEEIDPISDVISVNTVNFQIKTHSPAFSPVSGDVADDMLMRNQVMEVFCDGALYGMFFLQTWKDAHNTGTTFDFYGYDAVGAMDNYMFMGDIYVGVDVEVVIKQIFDICFPTGLVGYELDPAFADSKLTGWIPICTCREALQQICFAIGAVVDMSRRRYVWIYPREVPIETDITYSATDKMPWVDIRNLNRSDLVSVNVMTMEHNFNILDGEMTELPDNPTPQTVPGWWSASMSGDDGDFLEPPILTASFGTEHGADEMTLHFTPFSDDYAKDVRITWYSSGGEIIKTGVYTFDNNVAVVKEAVEPFRKIVYEILSTNVRNRYLKLQYISYGYTMDIPLSDIYIGGNIEPNVYYSGVDLVSHEYVKTNEEQEIHNGALAAGEYNIEFSEPMHTLTVSGATIINSNANHARIHVAVDGIVIMSGRKYISNTLTHSVRAEIAAGETENIATFDKCTVITNGMAKERVDDVWSYLRHKLSIENDVRINGLETGYIARMHTYGYPIVGVLERLEINLRGGRAKAKVVGDVVKSSMG